MALPKRAITTSSRLMTAIKRNAGSGDAMASCSALQASGLPGRPVAGSVLGPNDRPPMRCTDWANSCWILSRAALPFGLLAQSFSPDALEAFSQLRLYGVNVFHHARPFQRLLDLLQASHRRL